MACLIQYSLEAKQTLDAMDIPLRAVADRVISAIAEDPIKRTREHTQGMRHWWGLPTDDEDTYRFTVYFSHIVGSNVVDIIEVHGERFPGMH